MRNFLRVTKALNDKTRVRIFKMLQQKEMCVCEVQAALGMAQSTTSKHLNILEDAGLIARRKDGLWVNYGIDKHSYNPHAEAIITYLRSILDDDPDVKADVQKARTVNRLEICSR
ncbi:MAG: winged helix-turn-helix transcriptional regulator [Deltaproteobacteria bacterium]|nr:winged helix-turn-helix transcriptional regulator [Deltaproteobacteria bacterium]